MSSSHPLITIITPTYNAGKFISKCIESVQRQTFKNFEHLIMDGESVDDTVKQVLQFKQRYDTIRLEIEKDKGVYDAMNKGILVAKANWLYFLGADDYLYDNNVLKNISEQLLKTDSQIVYGDVFFQNLQRLYDKDFDIEKILTHNICHQAVFYHADVFKMFGHYDLAYKSESDYDLNLRCWLSGRVNHLYVPLTIAYYADGGISSTQKDEQLIKDYPVKTIDTVLAGRWNLFMKIHFLSNIYRKIFLRKVYSSGILFSQLFKKDFFLYRFLAFLWMCLSLPYHFLKNPNKTK
jgi:glycosyltransferase involved in cell wall biosynthesis